MAKSKDIRPKHRLGDTAGSSGSSQQTRANNYYGTRAELGRVIASGMGKGGDVLQLLRSQFHIPGNGRI